MTELDDRIFISLRFLLIEAAPGVTLLEAKTITLLVKAGAFKTVISYEANSAASFYQ